MQANHCKHVRTFLIGYRSGGTPCVFKSRGVCWNCGPLTREQCLPAPRRPPGSSCCLSLLASGFWPTTKSQFDNYHFLLSKLKNGKVKAKFIGTQEKKKLPRQLWVPKPQKWFICVYVNYKASGKHWVLDSGCTQHMTGYVKMFTSLDEEVGDHEHVTFGDNSKGKVVGLGRLLSPKTSLF